MRASPGNITGTQTSDSWVSPQYDLFVKDHTVADLKAALGFLVGQVMKVTAGKASPSVVNSLLVEKLSKL